MPSLKKARCAISLPGCSSSVRRRRPGVGGVVLESAAVMGAKSVGLEPMIFIGTDVRGLPASAARGSRASPVTANIATGILRLIIGVASGVQGWGVMFAFSARGMPCKFLRKGLENHDVTPVKHGGPTSQAWGYSSANPRD